MLLIYLLICCVVINQTGHTALMLAVMGKHRGCVNILLDKGALKDEKDNVSTFYCSIVAYLTVLRL